MGIIHHHYTKRVRVCKEVPADDTIGSANRQTLSVSDGHTSKPTLSRLLAGEAAVVGGHYEGPYLVEVKRSACGHSVFTPSPVSLPEAPINDARG